MVLKIPERIPLSTTDGTGTGDTTDALFRIKFNKRVNEEISGGDENHEVVAVGDIGAGVRGVGLTKANDTSAEPHTLL